MKKNNSKDKKRKKITIASEFLAMLDKVNATYGDALRELANK